jgi:hypothetical protein
VCGEESSKFFITDCISDYFETISDVDECTQSDTCEQICENTKGGFTCSCRPGYVVNAEDPTTCDGMYFLQMIVLLYLSFYKPHFSSVTCSPIFDVLPDGFYIRLVVSDSWLTADIKLSEL